MRKPGLGQRLIDRIKALRAGFYIDREAKFGIKVTEFALDHRYPPGSVYKWVGDVVMPDHETILRLARDLDAAPGWLHYGDEGASKPRHPMATRGVQVQEKPLPAETSSSLKKKHTKHSVSARKDGRDATLRQLRRSDGRTMARRLLRPVRTPASGGRRCAA